MRYSVIPFLVGEGSVVDAVLVVHPGARVHPAAKHRQELGKEPVLQNKEPL